MFPQEETPLYRTEPKREVLILGGSAALFLSGLVFSGGVEPPDSASLRSESIPFMDRFAVNFGSEKADRSSDLTLAFGCAMPLLALSDPGVRESAGKHALLYLESGLVTAGLVLLSKGIVRRPRPYAYRFAEEGRPLTSDAARSFFSGHTALAFNGAVVAGMMMLDGARNSVWKQPVWAAGLSAASLTGVFRILAGKHFPTDVLAGALAGSAAAFLVYRAHR